MESLNTIYGLIGPVGVELILVAFHGSHSNDIRAEVAYLFHRNFKKVSHGLSWLKLISVISPLLGLLGTVFGMVAVFKSISLVDTLATEVLAAGFGRR